ncbi:MAG: AAA family ATPase, partial [Candidatus Poribacteria bacterium]|nr:AAA family ATPase [Candidatus Poribacteria bacterium]
MSEPKTPETSEMLEQPKVEIAVKNFGPIAEATIDLRPLTVFVGASNTGKTYFSTLIYALHGIFNGFSQLPGLPGQIEHFGLYNFFGNMTEIRRILKKLNTPGQSFKFSDLPKEIQDMIQIKIKDSDSLGAELKRCFDLNSVRELVRLKDDQRNEMLVSLKVSQKNQSLWNFNFETFRS